MRKGGAGSKCFGEYQCSTQLMRDVIGSAGCCNRCRRQCVACSFGQSRHPRIRITLDDGASVWCEEQRSSERGAHQQRLFHHPHTVLSGPVITKHQKVGKCQCGFQWAKMQGPALLTARLLPYALCTRTALRTSAHGGAAGRAAGEPAFGPSLLACALIQFISPLTHSRESPGALEETNPEAPLANHRLTRHLFVSRPVSRVVACCRLSLIRHTHSARSP